jgi:hypothetical protein
MSILTTLLSNVTGATAGGVLGGALRLIPEGIKYFDDRDQRKHELEMSKVQLQIDAARSAQQIDLVHAQGAAEVDAGEIQALIESVKGQSQLTGVKWVDAVSATVRPFVTYGWLILFAVYKACLVRIALGATVSLGDFAAKVWTADDAAIFSGILSFWFISRELAKRK